MTISKRLSDKIASHGRHGKTAQTIADLQQQIAQNMLIFGQARITIDHNTLHASVDCGDAYEYAAGPLQRRIVNNNLIEYRPEAKPVPEYRTQKPCKACKVRAVRYEQWCAGCDEKRLLAERGPGLAGKYSADDLTRPAKMSPNHITCDLSGDWD